MTKNKYVIQITKRAVSQLFLFGNSINNTAYAFIIGKKS